MIRCATRVRSCRAYRPGLYYESPSKKADNIIRLADHPKFGWKKQPARLEHLEYLQRKSELERDDTERWEVFDWNIDQEIYAFGHRIGVEMTGELYTSIRWFDSDVYLDQSDKIATIIKEYILDKTAAKSEMAAEEIAAHLARVENVAKTAKALGFHNLLQIKAPSDELIASAFSMFLSEVDSAQLVRDLFTAELIGSHNILTLWPRAWENAEQCLEEVLNQSVECRLVKSVGINGPMPTYVIAVFDEEKNFLARSIGESPYLAAMDACRVALQTALNFKP